MSDTTGKITLATPIVRRFRATDGTEREETITEVTVRPPLARDLRATDRHEGEAAKGIALAAHLTGLSIAEVDALPLPDFKRLMEAVEGPTAAGPETGPTS